MTVEIPSALVERIMRSAGVIDGGAPAPEEKCGILRGRGETITRADETLNVSATPSVAFEIDPAALLKAYREQRRSSGLDVIGFFHTHPNGSDLPSPRDAECAAPDGKLWLIATSSHARIWRAVADGPVHGRFAPVAFDIKVGKRIERNVPGVQHRDVGRKFTVAFEPERFS